MKWNPLLFVLVLALCSCGRATLPPPERAFRPTSPIAVADDLGIEDLRLALQTQSKFFEQHPCAKNPMRFGIRSIACEDYQRALREFLAFLEHNPSFEAVTVYLAEHFEFLEVYGRDAWGEVLLTSYFEPVIPGSREPTAQQSQPLYTTPRDLLYLSPQDVGLEGTLRRVRVDGRKVQSYYSRAEIDSEKRIASTADILAWVDPVDAFFLQIQGSGTVTYADGSEAVLGYAEKNGQAYVALAAALKDKLSERPITMSTLQRYLRSLDPQERQRALNLNPSYVFFKQNLEHAITKLGIPAFAGRSIATDQTYFPKGSLGILEFADPRDGATRKRFVFDHDIGGAIRGPGRVDLFWGRGPDAGEIAGQVNGKARLLYLLPK